MNGKKIFGIVLLVLLFLGVVSLLFLPIHRPVKTTTGHYRGQSGEYIELSSKSSHVNIKDFPNLPKLYKGDFLEVKYYRTNILYRNRVPYLNDVISIKKLYGYDWGISLNPVEVSPTGIQLEMKVTRTLSEDLAISAYSLEVCNENQWQPVAPLSQGTSLSPIFFTDGTPVTLNWVSTYGILESGLYRLTVTVTYEGETRDYDKLFSVPQPMPTTLDGAVAQTVQYFLSKEIIAPSQEAKDIQRIAQDSSTGFWSNPTNGILAGTSFDQITCSHEIYEHRQDGALHNYKIIGMCRGYNKQVPVREFGAPIWLTIRENQDGTFDAISFQMPYETRWTTSCPQFPTSTKRAWDFCLLFEFRDKLRAACDAQVLGGVTMPDIRGLDYIVLDEDSSEANKIFKLVASDPEVPVPDKLNDETKDKQDQASFTILIGDRIYYVIKDYIRSTDTSFYNLYSVEDDICIKVIGDDYKMLKRIYNDPKTNLIDVLKAPPVW